MTIETKYNIGDKVYINILGRSRKVEITDMVIYVLPDGDVIIIYQLVVSSSIWTRKEEEIFPTKEELLKSL